MKRTALAFLAAAALASSAVNVRAHAFLDHALPAVGSTVHGSPPELRLWFTQALEPAFSSVKVVDASGKQVDKGDSTVDAQDRELLKLSLPALAPGDYKVMWRVTSVDTHTTTGSFTIHIVP
ncbi:MAG TPA: copper resistance CopC family protein [Alphaproteobacteria bacterium]|nr:copper resistance CopC family protein [Alphaproteobacteria bacterium]